MQLIDLVAMDNRMTGVGTTLISAPTQSWSGAKRSTNLPLASSAPLQSNYARSRHRIAPLVTKANAAVSAPTQLRQVPLALAGRN